MLFSGTVVHSIGSAEGVYDRLPESGNLIYRQPSSWALGVYACEEKRLVCIQVAQAAGYALLQQQGFYRGFSPGERLCQSLNSKLIVEGFGAHDRQGVGERVH